MITRWWQACGLALGIAAAPVLAGEVEGPVVAAANAFGTAVAVGPDEVLVGEPQNATEPGYVYVYRRGSDGTWTERARLQASDAAPGDGFGAALVVQGNRLVVARQQQPHGAVYVFERQADGTWRETAHIAAPETMGAATLFGFAIALDGDALLVGAPLTSEQAGAVFAFRREASGAWAPAGRLNASDARNQSFFGTSIALSGGDALIAGPGGGVYAFRSDGTTWTETGKLDLGGARPTGIQRAVALHEGRALVANLAGNGGTGLVLTYAKDAAGAWSRTGSITPPDSVQGLGFGSALAVDGNALWIGAVGANERRGGVYVFDRSGDGYRLRTTVSPDGVQRNDAFGGALAVRNGVAAVGLVGADYGAGKAMILEAGATQRWVAAATVFSEMRGYAAVRGNAVACSEGKTDTFSCGGNVELLAFLPIQDIGGGRGVQLNDIWGWIDPQSNREYALVGRNDAAAFVDITDPVNPIYVGQLPRTEGSPASAWRDIKVYRNHAFIVSDAAGNHGMQVFDLTRLREYNGTPITFSPDTTYDRIASAHNIVINEETGFAYPVGSGGGGETCGGGLHMIDIRDPKKPTFIGCFADPQTGNAGTGYSHDAQCVLYHGPDEQYRGREICVGSNETAISIADVTDKQNPKAISRAAYPNVAYTHQGWFTDDHRYFYVNDEGDEVGGLVPRTRTLVWDLADLDDPVLVREHLGETPASDHNLYVRGNLMYQSNYSSGLRILDISDPANPREVGYLDTNPVGNNEAGFNGSWSNYPFFPSGTIAVSSIEQGLFLVRYRGMRPIS